MQKNNIAGALSALIIGSITFLLLFGVEPISHINSNFTSAGSDALKDIFNTHYSVKYDTTYLQNNSMNYPYGDHYTYTGNQIFVSWPIKCMKETGIVDLSNYITGLVNFFIYLSVILCVLFLFLLFRELKLSLVVSVFGALVITFLSPQIDRIAAHLTLAYECLIPLILLLFLKFSRQPKYCYSVLLGITFFLCGIVHPYFLVFYAVVFGMFWFVKIIIHDGSCDTKQLVYSILIQFVVPIVCFFLLTKLGDPALDRTSIPWGFKVARARIEGLLLPVGRIYYPSFLPSIHWEAHSYIGLIGDICFVCLLAILFKKLFTGECKSILKVTDNYCLNIFFWASLILVACAIILPLFPEHYLNYVGPLAQMRAMGRFGWLFYYVINIVAIYLLTQFVQNRKSKLVKGIVTLSVVFCYSFEAYSYASTKNIRNDNADFFDYNNTLPQNAWVDSISATDYQSLLALPYFNLGTEHVWIEPEDDIFTKSIYVSMKTGLPMHNAHAARSCISQAYRNIPFKWEPYRDFPVLMDLSSQKPILTITKAEQTSLNENEKRILQYSNFLFSANGINFYKTEIDSLRKLCSNYQKQLATEYRSTKKIHDSIKTNYYFQGWDSIQSAYTYQGEGALEGIINSENVLYNTTMPVYNCDTIEILFAMGNNYTEDLYGRTVLTVAEQDSVGKTVLFKQNSVFHFVENIVDDWGLIRITIPVEQNAKTLKISLSNTIMLSKPVYFDNLIIKPKGLKVVCDLKGRNTLNNLPVIGVE